MRGTRYHIYITIFKIHGHARLQYKNMSPRPFLTWFADGFIMNI